MVKNKKHNKKNQTITIEKEIPNEITFTHFPCKNCKKNVYIMETRNAKSWCKNCKKTRHEGIKW